MTEYEKIYQFDNLYQAYRKAASCKRSKGEVITFELNLSENLCRMYFLDLRSGLMMTVGQAYSDGPRSVL